MASPGQTPSVTFVGTGEALDPELPNTSLLLRCGAEASELALLMDCGYAVPHALWQLTRDVELLDAVWISHGHADHCFGLPALLLWMRLGGRRRPLKILGGPGSAARLRQVLELGYPGSYAPHKCYPIEFVELEPGGPARLGPCELRVAASAHSIANYALRVDAPGQRSLMYSGDGATTPGTRALATLAGGVSVLVHECFFPAPPQTGARKHGDVEGCVELARDARVETLALLHFAAEAKSAIRTHAATLCEAASLNLLTPAPGEVLELGIKLPAPG